MYRILKSSTFSYDKSLNLLAFSTLRIFYMASKNLHKFLEHSPGLDLQHSPRELDVFYQISNGRTFLFERGIKSVWDRWWGEGTVTYIKHWIVYQFSEFCRDIAAYLPTTKDTCPTRRVYKDLLCNNWGVLSIAWNNLYKDLSIL